MNHRWGSSEGIRVGDIFRCDSAGMLFSGRPEAWEPWDVETAKRLEAERYAAEAALEGEAGSLP